MEPGTITWLSLWRGRMYPRRRMTRSLLEPNSLPRKLTTPSLMALRLSVRRSHRPPSILVSVLIVLARPKASVGIKVRRNVANPVQFLQPEYSILQCKYRLIRGQYGHHWTGMA